MQAGVMAIYARAVHGLRFYFQFRFLRNSNCLGMSFLL